MYNCPHCGKATFVGGGVCNHCNKAFTIAKLEDIFMKSDGLESIGTRVVPGDDGKSLVVMLLVEKGKKGKPDTRSIAVHEYKPAGGGWTHWTGRSYDLPLAGEIAKAVLEVAP